MVSLINSVVPSEGVYCLATILDGAIQQTFYDDLGELIADGQSASYVGRNAYYAMASFNDGSSRSQQNVKAIKAFWLDVDCKDKDPAKDYANKDEGRKAINDFINKFNFPKPTIVDSGNGWHVYWILEEELTPTVWQPIAEKLKTVCLKNGLRIDPACTADSARILRIPDTFNYRYDPPSQVVVIRQSPAVSITEFTRIVDAAYGPFRISNNPHKHRVSAATLALAGNHESSFKKIIEKNRAGSGCEQLINGMAHQADIDEPLWRGLLSVANACREREKAIAFVSNKHPDYNEGEAIRKAALTKGPYTCTTFNELNAGVCTSCTHWGKIKSPIVIGHEVITIQEPVVLDITPEPIKEAEESSTTDTETILWAEEKLETYAIDGSSVIIPVPPAPYSRGAKGGIYKRVSGVDGTFDDVLIYENDLYAYARLFDPIDGQVLACRLHLPLDGVREFNVPLHAVGSKERLREIVCKQGVAANDKVIAELSAYLIAMAKELQHMKKEEHARTQMGWQPDGSFVIGAREYSKDGIRNCPPSNSTLNYQHKFRMEGKLSEWLKVIDVYNRPGFEVHQFVFFLALASPLLKHIDNTGMLTSMISDESGLGKTTLCLACNSIWGHPFELMSKPKDTTAALLNRMGIFNSMAVMVDEVTNKDSKTCSDIIYMATHGEGPARMEGSRNVERVNNTKWNLNVIATANASIRDKVSTLKASSEGENMRLFEFDMRGTPALPKAEADAIFPLLNDNYGVAGHLLAAWLVKNVNTIKGSTLKTQRTMDYRFSFNSKERYWSASVAAAYTMAYITKGLGLHNIDVDNNINFMVDYMGRMRGDVKDGVTPHSAVIADFMSENHGNIIVANGLKDSNGLMEEPRNYKHITKIVGRYEPDTGMLYLCANPLRDYCVKKQFSFSSMRSLSGGRLESKRLASGTGLVAGAVRVMSFDTKAAGLNMAMWED